MMTASPSASGRKYKIAFGQGMGHVQSTELAWEVIVDRLAAAAAFPLVRIGRATRVRAGDAEAWATILSANSRLEVATTKALQKTKAPASEALPALEATDLCTALAAPRRQADNDIVARPAASQIAGCLSLRLGGAA